MAIRKPCSRFSDRNKIRRMYAEGYSIEQISAHLSITEDHIQYVLEQWDADEEAWRDKARAELMEAADEAKKALQPANPVPNINDEERERIRQKARRELMEELRAEAEAADETQAEKAAPKKPRRRRAQQEDADAA